MKRKGIITLFIILSILIISSIIILPRIFPQLFLSEELSDYQLVNAFPNIVGKDMTDLHQYPDDNKLVVANQDGILFIFENMHDVQTSSTYLDIRDRVLSGGELGLLGFDFHPNFTNNGFVFVDYTTDLNGPRRTIISRFTQVDGALDPVSEKVILEVEQPYTNHNAGQLMFGLDGFLYITLGDGGSGGDPENNGQDPTTLLGSILRIDINVNDTYAIPSDNPFVGNLNGWREEIYAYGLRNPWRISQDPVTGKIWVADVGQNSYEEVDILVKGGNYGWNIKEGFHCYSENNCEDPMYDDLTDPELEYGRSLGGSITGGFVYRGTQFTDLIGSYIYGDYSSGRIWQLKKTNEGYNNTLVGKYKFLIASFGVDDDGVLYVLARPDNIIYRFQEL